MGRPHKNYRLQVDNFRVRYLSKDVEKARKGNLRKVAASHARVRPGSQQRLRKGSQFALPWDMVDWEHSADLDEEQGACLVSMSATFGKLWARVMPAWSMHNPSGATG